MQQQAFSGQLNRALITPQQRSILPTQSPLWCEDNMLTNCARKQCTPSLQALAGKRVVTSLLGHSSLVALCSLAFSQVGH